MTNQEIDEGVVEPGDVEQPQPDDLSKIVELSRLVELTVDATVAYMRGKQTAEWLQERFCDLVDRAYSIGSEETKTDFEKESMIDDLKAYGTLE